MSAGQVISVIQTALPVLLTLALGMLCRSRSFLSREGVDTTGMPRGSFPELTEWLENL